MPPASAERRKYARLTRSLHWIVAVMVLATLPIGYSMVQEGLERPTQNLLFILHKNGGVILLVLVLMRIAWRLMVPAPPMPAHIPGWQAKVAKTVQFGLYTLLLVMTISGYVRVRAGGFPIEMLDPLGLPGFIPRSDALAATAKAVHANARFLLVGLMLLHIAAGMKHLLARDGIFGRIWPPLGR